MQDMEWFKNFLPGPKYSACINHKKYFLKKNISNSPVCSHSLGICGAQVGVRKRRKKRRPWQWRRRSRRRKKQTKKKRRKRKTWKLEEERKRKRMKIKRVKMTPPLPPSAPW